MSNTERGFLIVAVAFVSGPFLALFDHSLNALTPPFPGVIIWATHSFVAGICMMAVAPWERRKS
jgi:hypothetical protein